MIAEMKATLLRCDLEVEPEEEEEEEEDPGFRTEKGDDYDDEEDRERERVLRLLEDVTRKVKRLAEDRDPADLDHPRPVAIAEIEYDNSLGPPPTLLYRASLEGNVKCSQVTTH